MNLYILSFSFEGHAYRLKAMVKASNEQEAWAILKDDQRKGASSHIVQHSAYYYTWNELDTIKYFV